MDNSFTTGPLYITLTNKHRAGRTKKNFRCLLMHKAVTLKKTKMTFNYLNKTQNTIPSKGDILGYLNNLKAGETYDQFITFKEKVKENDAAKKLTVVCERRDVSTTFSKLHPLRKDLNLYHCYLTRWNKNNEQKQMKTKLVVPKFYKRKPTTRDVLEDVILNYIYFKKGVSFECFCNDFGYSVDDKADFTFYSFCKKLYLDYLEFRK